MATSSSTRAMPCSPPVEAAASHQQRIPLLLHLRRPAGTPQRLPPPMEGSGRRARGGTPRPTHENIGHRAARHDAGRGGRV
eukprot:scaffold8224_cov118-Isochrysis_galbana.AAC.3